MDMDTNHIYFLKIETTSLKSTNNRCCYFVLLLPSIASPQVSAPTHPECLVWFCSNDVDDAFFGVIFALSLVINDHSFSASNRSKMRE